MGHRQSASFSLPPLPHWLLKGREKGGGNPNFFQDPPPSNYHMILLDLVRKNDLGLWFCFLLEEGRFRRLWPKKRSFPAIFGPKCTFNPPPEFFQVPLDVWYCSFCQKTQIGVMVLLWIRRSATLIILAGKALERWKNRKTRNFQIGLLPLRSWIRVWMVGFMVV